MLNINTKIETSLKQNILDKIKEDQSSTIKDLVYTFDSTKQTVIKHLNSLILEGFVTKNGKAPRTFYSLSKLKNTIEEIDNFFEHVKIPEEILSVIEENYDNINAFGEKTNGIKGFKVFCGERNMNLEKSAKDFFEVYKKYNHFKKDGYINASFKIEESFNDNFLDKMFYIDFYAFEKYGKTKLGQLVSSAKQSGDKSMTKEVIKISRTGIENVIKKYTIDAVAYVPPTIKREVQIMKELESGLALNLPKINIFKIINDVMVPQKTLSKIKDRILNAANTMFVEGNIHYKNILIIDDAVGSGATLHEIAKKIKNKKIVDKVFGLSIVGSFKGFDALNEI